MKEESEGEDIDKESDEGGETKEDSGQWLTTSEFILMNLSRHYSIEDYSMYKYEDPSVSINVFHILMAYVVVGIPIGYMEIVLGQYTHMGMFHIKHLMPIAQGMSYTFCLQVFAITTLCVLLMTQFFVYALLSLVHTGTGMVLPWLECPRNYTHICFLPSDGCEGEEPCITAERHLSTYIYWNKIYMRGVLSREEAYIGVVPIHRMAPLMITWAIVWVTMKLNLKNTKRFIKCAFIVLLVHKFMQFIACFMNMKWFAYMTYLIHIDMRTFINIQAWKHAIVKVTMGMGLGDFSYIMFGILSKTSRKTGSLMWLCGLMSLLLTLMDHIVLSNATYFICELAKLGVEKRYLLFRPGNVQHELGVWPIIFESFMGASLWNAMYFMHRFCVLLFHAMLNYTFLQLSLYQKFPVLQAYTMYIKPLFCIFGYGICLLLDSREAYSVRYDIHRVVTEFCDQFNIIIITVIVFYIYGVAKFCDDVHFMTGQEPAKYWMIVWLISPVVIFISMPLDLFDSRDFFYMYRVTTIAVFYLPYIFYITVTVIQKIYQKKLLTLLRSTSEWGPLDPIQRLFRQSFNPRLESKRKNKSYKCAHVCLIEAEIPASEEEDERDDGLPVII